MTTRIPSAEDVTFHGSPTNVMPATTDGSGENRAQRRAREHKEEKKRREDLRQSEHEERLRNKHVLKPLFKARTTGPEASAPPDASAPPEASAPRDASAPPDASTPKSKIWRCDQCKSSNRNQKCTYNPALPLHACKECEKKNLECTWIHRIKRENNRRGANSGAASGSRVLSSEGPTQAASAAPAHTSSQIHENAPASAQQGSLEAPSVYPDVAAQDEDSPGAWSPYNSPLFRDRPAAPAVPDRRGHSNNSSWDSSNLPGTPENTGAYSFGDLSQPAATSGSSSHDPRLAAWLSAFISKPVQEREFTSSLALLPSALLGEDLESVALPYTGPYPYPEPGHGADSGTNQ